MRFFWFKGADKGTDFFSPHAALSNTEAEGLGCVGFREP